MYVLYVHGRIKLIQLDHITKTFDTGADKVHAVSDVTLHIKSGEIFGIIGFSGAGKSTLVRCINLLERPTSGTVTVDGKVLTDLPAKELREARKKIGMIFQHFNLMRSRTVGENVAYPLKGSGLTKQQIKAKVKELLEFVDIAEKENAYPSQLSGGQKQRVAIARALANDPKVLLCDEATSALDPQTTGGITRDFIRTTSNLQKIEKLIEDKSPLVALKPGEKILRLNYIKKNTSEALISETSRKFNINLNIIFADLEIVQDAPIGGTVAIASGKKEDIEAAVEYLKEKNVGVEVLENG